MEYLDFKTLVIFDALSFVLNGVLIWIFQGKMENANQNAVTNKPKILNFNLSAYLKQHPKLAFEEIMVTLTQAGANTLGIVLLMDQPKLIPILISIFGATVWASSYFMHLPARLWKANAIWWVYAVVLLCIGIFKDSPMHILALFAVAYMCYWILLQRIGKQLMQECPSHNYSQIVASRNAINLAILSSGEVWVGAKLIPLSLELGWRAGVSAIGGIIEKAKK
ncbi:MAG TPA: hypothetical protein PKC28_04685 [Bdellovibrionales bacterium]|nr:hypothetical protein [Bdellovibrionales bacterium]